MATILDFGLNGYELIAYEVWRSRVLLKISGLIGLPCHLIGYPIGWKNQPDYRTAISFA